MRLPESQNAKPASGFDLPFAFTHPLLQGATLSDPNPTPGKVVRHKMHEAGESHFRAALLCVKQGWSVYPQTAKGARRPALIDGQSVTPKLYRDVLPPIPVVEWWIAKTPSSNVALQLGPSSGHTFAIDIDVDSPADASWIIRLAMQHLGSTPFLRQGRAPRMVLIYRREPSKPVRSRALRIAGSDDAIEILGDGKSVTIYGTHHKTGDYFKWGAKAPAMLGPEAAPLVTDEQLTAFLDAVDHWKELAGYRAQPVSHFSSEVVDFDGTVNSPRNKMSNGTWEKQGLGKVIVDGRQAWLFSQALAYARLNAEAVRTDEGAAAVYSRYLAEALRYVARTGRWSSDAAIEAECKGIWSRTRDNLRADRIKAQVVSIREDGTREIASTGGVLAIAGDLGEAADWIAPAGSKARRKSPTRIVAKTDDDHKPCPERAKKLALLDSAARVDVGQLVSAKVAEAIDSFLNALWDNAERIAEMISEGTSMPEALREVGALIAPTGAGKTSTLVRRFVSIREQRGPLPFALAVFLPTHANAMEAYDTASAAGATDVWAEVTEAGRGVKVMHYRGKAAAGCKLLEIRKKLQDADISTGQMCKRDIVDDYGEKGEELCVHYNSCPSIAQERLAQEADIILLPHAFLSSPLPKAVSKRIGAVVIDERFWSGFAKSVIIPLDTLRRPRKEPYLLPTDKRDGITVRDYIDGREKAADIAAKALLAGKCPAHAIACYSYKSVLPGRKQVRIDGLELARAAKTVCSRAKQSRLDVRPNMPSFEVEELVSRPEGENLMAEWRFWALVEEIIVKYRQGKLAADKRDIRIKNVTMTDAKGGDVPGIRIAWRNALLMSDRPAFLLDASADPAILGKLYPNRPIRVHRVEAPLHLRCVVVADGFSDQALLPASNKNPEDRERAAIKLSKVRSLITRLGGLYADQRILVGSTLPVEKALKESWASPKNTDFGHYGAFRGLDAYKNHTVALSIGRMELPMDVLDGLCAAFSYDDPEPEADWNHTGTGWDGTQKIRAPKGERRLQRRDGAFVTVADSVFPEEYRWHRAIQAQWREEELRQFAGRLRPVYPRSWTTEAPLWICAATCVPDGIVVDDIVTLDDLIQGDTAHDLARRMRGVIDEKAAPLLDVSERLIGIDMAGMSARSSAGYATVRIWTDGNPEGRLVRVAAWVPDLWSALEDAQRRLGHELDRYEVVRAAPAINPLAMVPEPSKLDRLMSRLPNAQTATRDELLQERADAEELLRERVAAAPRVAGRRTEISMILACYPIAEPEPPPRALAA